MSTITLIAIIVPLVWVGWLILTEWVPMFPLNDLEASPCGNAPRQGLSITPSG
jgi:hypothetical protein